VAALSGGVFQNLRLLGLLVDKLDSAGFVVLTHEKAPPNDGGLALGQAIIGGLAPLED
jgi:hydrogenase maturation protein HypF